MVNGYKDYVKIIRSYKDKTHDLSLTSTVYSTTELTSYKYPIS